MLPSLWSLVAAGQFMTSYITSGNRVYVAATIDTPLTPALVAAMDRCITGQCCCHSGHPIDHTPANSSRACKISSQRTTAAATGGGTSRPHNIFIGFKDLKSHLSQFSIAEIQCDTAESLGWRIDSWISDPQPSPFLPVPWQTYLAMYVGRELKLATPWPLQL